MYIYGRDRYYRPTFIVDAVSIQNFNRQEQKQILGSEFNEAFYYLYNYIKKVMLLPGQIDYCNLIVNLGKQSVTEMPRELITAFAKLSQENIMFFMAKSFYLNLSWG